MGLAISAELRKVAAALVASERLFLFLVLLLFLLIGVGITVVAIATFGVDRTGLIGVAVPVGIAALLDFLGTDLPVRQALGAFCVVVVTLAGTNVVLTLAFAVALVLLLVAACRAIAAAVATMPATAVTVTAAALLVAAAVLVRFVLGEGFLDHRRR
jgi:hypothetical protein